MMPNFSNKTFPDTLTSNTDTRARQEPKNYQDDYEEIKSAGIGANMIAGGAAGIVEHCVMYPVDCIKTRMMALLPHKNASYRSIISGLNIVAQRESPRNLIKGVGLVAGGAGPAHAFYYTTYETLKRKLTPYTKEDSILNFAISGCVATLVHDTFMTPVDAVKQRVQNYNSPYRNVYHAISQMYVNEGLRAFYRSFTTQLSMNIPTLGTNFVVYESVHLLMNPERYYNPKVHVLAGCIAGASAAAISTPMDVAKTLLNIQETKVTYKLQNNKPIIGIYRAFELIYKTNGWLGFSKGLRARVVYMTPSTGISWSVYELFKYMLGLRNGKNK